MKTLLYLLVFISMAVKAQVTQTSTNTSEHDGQYSSVKTGIYWTEGLSWQEIKEKAKRENKYIFLDCFTTWCRPCKLMDKEVYINDTVGKLINDKFISVRVQIDNTKNDNEYIKSWYQDATNIRTHYLLDGYPSFLFFNPAGEIIHKESGYKKVEKFITIVQTALTPGRKWNDDYAEYMKLMDDYYRGNINYDRLPLMITTAKKLGDTVSKQLLRLHSQYESSLPITDRYSKEKITFWSTLNLSSKSPILQFFYRDKKKIDQVMQKKGYSQEQVDKNIQNIIVASFIKEQLKNPATKTTVAKFDPETGTLISKEPCYDEADWKKLNQIIRMDFNKSYAKRNLQKAKATWYQRNRNWLAYAKVSLENLKASPPDFTEQKTGTMLNEICWNIFQRVTDKKMINESIIWMEKVVKIWNYGYWIDTYANLLYKAGQKEEAIKWQEKAVSLSPKYKPMQLALEQMKKGEPTYKAAWETTNK